MENDMYKLICFDVDNTIAPINGPVKASTIEKIRHIIKNGVQVVFISGKPASYLAGMVRQMGIEDVILAGGNGEMLYASHEFPPKFFLRTEIDIEVDEFLRSLENKLRDQFRDEIWFQPNDSLLGIFHYQKEEIRSGLLEIVKREISNSKISERLNYYDHVDCLDVLPIHISKGNMVRRLSERLNISLKGIISVGDSINDVSMFEISGLKIGINTEESIAVDKRFGDIDTALDYIIKLL